MLEHYIHQLCDAFTDAISISDRHGAIVLVNKQHADMTGVRREDMIGRSVQTLVSDGVFDVVLNPEIVREKRSASCVQNTATGKKLVLNGHPLFGPDGDVQFVVTFIRDITVLSSLKNEIALQKELLEAFQRLSADAVQDPPLVVVSQAMKKLYQEIESLAETDATALLLGETGVGKDVVARAIHARSRRQDKVFIKVDCGAIPENLVETELFGYVGGTFSGASKQGKVGLIEAAASGTLFLDEVGELPLQVQSRLLRFLQDREVMRVGATSARRVDARIIAATNRDLQKAVHKGTFRSDLYYRLKVAVLTIPPLRRRKDDIRPMAESFLAFFAGKYGKKMAFTKEALKCLRAYAWPGNVRELENMIQRLVIMGKGELIDAPLLPIAAAQAAPGDQGAETDSGTFSLADMEGKSLRDIMRETEAAVLREALRRYGGIAAVAERLQADRSTIFRKVREYGLQG